MAHDKSDLGEQALGKAVEVGLSAQLDEAEELEADIDADPISLMQGEVDSADIEGEGLVMKQDLRAEKLTLESDGISIDPGKAAFGDIELTRSTNATTVVTLTETDIERAFNSDFIHQQLQGLKVDQGDRSLCVDIQNVQFSLPGAGKVSLVSDVKIRDTQETKRLAFSAKPEIGPQGHQVVLKDIQIETGEELEALTQNLLKATSGLLDLRNFELDGMSLRLQDIDVQSGKMVLTTQTHLEKFPGT